MADSVTTSRSDPYVDGPVEPVASVVIPTHDGAATLGAQLDALAAQVDAPPFEVVVVLNRCTDDSRAVAEGFRDRLAIRCVTADDAPGVAYTRNVGWRATAAPFVLYCDADDRVDEGWVAGMVEPLAARRADLVGGRIIVDRRELIGRRAWIYDERYRWMDGGCLHMEDPRRPLGAAMGIARSLLVALDGFDERFGTAGGEEVDFTRRAALAGARIGEAPAAALLYRPRTTRRAVTRQLAGYARGHAIQMVIEGRGPRRPPRGPLHLRWLVLRKAAKAFTRRGVRDPRRLLLKVVWDFHVMDEYLRRTRTTGVEPGRPDGPAASRP